MNENIKNVQKISKEFLQELQQQSNKVETFEAVKTLEFDLEKLISINAVDKEFSLKRAKKFKAVNNMNLTLYQGQNVALLGSNGAGKTTTVEMIVGISKPTKGEIVYHFENEKSNTNSLIGIQFQDSSYPQGLSVSDVIKSMQKIYGSALGQEDIDNLIKIFGVDEFIFNKASSLSGGQQQRLNALLSIIHCPKLIILDELSTGLDIKIKSRLIHFIKKFAIANQSSILLISHDINEIELIADRIIIMHKGRIILDQLKEDVIKNFGSVANCLDKYIG
ncbi:ABC transporter ATP-binding protein [Mycoplasma seminis]|uniref:ATP-binding cassette domain-containing protein n=1 Tax=Mycoplasma seminis TaxID=512749 RepID=A0ABY9HAV0_9MOLU|nr:ATP-binding cassette domain-containing protein [Mycoplasma seminis]WLP85381.1 ATP-binding cassette domain-containing protein [Mycoplasma seminis]